MLNALILQSPIDADVAKWVAAVSANGGSVSLPRRRLVSNLVRAWKSAGGWQLLDDAWILTAESSVQALTSLKQLRLATVVNSPTFTADRGYTFDGSTNYINTGFIPSTHAVSMTGTNLMIGAYQRTNIGTGRYAAGGYDFSTKALYVNARNGTNVFDAGANGAILAGANSDSRGLGTVSKSGSTVTVAMNGAVVTTATPSVGTVLPTRAIYIGALNNAGTASNYMAASQGAVILGASGPDTNVAFYKALQTFMTALGANV